MIFFLFIIKLTENMTIAFQENFLFVTLKKVAEDDDLSQ